MQIRTAFLRGLSRPQQCARRISVAYGNPVLHVAYGLVVIELLFISSIRHRYMSGNLWATIGQVLVGGGIVFGVRLLLEKAALLDPGAPGWLIISF
jgi:hypothetical protein